MLGMYALLLCGWLQVSHHAAMRRELLRREYMTPSGPPQPEHGFKGQLHACWHHSVTNDDVGVIRSGEKLPVVVVQHHQLGVPQPACLGALTPQV